MGFTQGRLRLLRGPGLGQVIGAQSLHVLHIINRTQSFYLMNNSYMSYTLLFLQYFLSIFLQESSHLYKGLSIYLSSCVKVVPRLCPGYAQVVCCSLNSTKFEFRKLGNYWPGWSCFFMFFILLFLFLSLSASVFFFIHLSWSSILF